MSLSVNYNRSVLITQRNLSDASKALNITLERMSTGFKVNRAADDAAGMYVSTKLNTQIRGLKQAQKNTNDGISFINTASSALDNMTQILNRLRDLALQGANGVYDEQARTAMQQETDSLTAQLLQIKNGTIFNGRQVLSAFSPFEINSQTAKGITPPGKLTETEAAAQGYTIIKTASDLDKVRNNLSGKYILMNDLDLSSINWKPIGSVTDGFKGIFDGNGYNINNLKILREDEEYIGLFGKTEAGSIVTNTTVSNANVTGKFEVGALAGEANGEISNCCSSGVVNGKGTVGGLIGKNTGHIFNNYSTSKVTGDNDAGGFVGYALGSIEKCYASGDVNGITDIGGFAGYLDGNIKECYAAGKAKGNDIVGGFIGYCYLGDITDSFSSGSAQGDENIGGFAGYIKYGNADRCYSSAYVNGLINTGGFAGWQTGSVSNSFWDTNVSAQNNACGSQIGPSDITGMPSSNFSVKSNFTAKGWSESVWNFDTPYPTLNKTPKPLPPDPPVPPDKESGIRLQIGANSDFFENSISFDTSFDLNTLDLDLSTTENCLAAIDKIDEAMDRISSKNSELGAVLNRLESVLNTQIIQIENFTSAKSTILDADISQEAAEYTRNQILQQAGASLLSQSQNLNMNVILGLIR